MTHALLLALFIPLTACSRPEQFTEDSHGIAVAVERSTPTGGAIYYSRSGSPWRLGAKGSDPSLSPNGQLLAFTHYQAGGSSHERFVRVIDLTTGSITFATKFEGATQQYAARWSLDARTVFFNNFVPNYGWTSGSFSYPALAYARVPDFPPTIYRSSASRDGRYRLSVETVPGDPPLAHDVPAALFLTDSQTQKRLRITPKDFWVPSGACWIDASHEVLVPGQWHSDYNSKSGKTYIYRIDPFARDWSSANKTEWTAKRLCEGWQVSCASE